LKPQEGEARRRGGTPRTGDPLMDDLIER
jgi:hypothetical protein